MKTNDILFCLAIALSLVVGAGCLRYGYQRGKRDALAGLKPQRDTIILRDTITRVKPIFVEINGEIRTDTLWLHDTLALPVPIEQKVYADSDYRAVVSGWHASLDTISVYPKTMVIMETTQVPVPAPPKRWGLGIAAGYGASKDGLSPYIGVGISYSILQW